MVKNISYRTSILLFLLKLVYLKGFSGSGPIVSHLTPRKTSVDVRAHLCRHGRITWKPPSAIKYWNWVDHSPTKRSGMPLTRSSEAFTVIIHQNHMSICGNNHTISLPNTNNKTKHHVWARKSSWGCRGGHIARRRGSRIDKLGATWLSYPR